MTTTIKLTTHDWPVAAETSDNHNFNSDTKTGWSSGTSTELVPANTTRDFYITDTRSMTFRELPKGTTSLLAEHPTISGAAARLQPATEYAETVGAEIAEAGLLDTSAATVQRDADAIGSDA